MVIFNILLLNIIIGCAIVLEKIHKLNSGKESMNN